MLYGTSTGAIGDIAIDPETSTLRKSLLVDPQGMFQPLGIAASAHQVVYARRTLHAAHDVDDSVSRVGEYVDSRT